MRCRAQFWLPVAVALGIQAVLGVSAANQLTPTHDEYWHLPVGLLNLKTGRFHYDNLNPPLCRVLAALSLCLTDARTGPRHVDQDPMKWGDQFLAENQEQYQRCFAFGRIVIVLITAGAGLATALFARQLFGIVAGVFAAILWAFEPNLIAHGSLVTTDMGAAAAFVLVMIATWQFATRPGWKSALLVGLVLGLAQLTKFTSLILYPVAIVEFVLAWQAVRCSPGRPSMTASSTPAAALPVTVGRLALFWLAAIGLSLLLLNAGYLFRGSLSPLRTYHFQSRSFASLAAEARSLDWFPIPLPRDYVEGLDHQRQIMEQKHPVFLDGQWSEVGFPNYYLWSMFYKLPHALQSLLVLTIIGLVIPGGLPRMAWTQVFLLLPAAALLVAAGESGMQLGVRYVLPALPFLILFASQSARWLDFKRFPVRATVAVSLVVGMIASVRYHPEHLAYFNELAGGPFGGREHLLDSNLDWGQDLGGLAQWVHDHNLHEIGLAYFGTVPPHAVGLEYHVPSSRIPEPGRYAVSVNFEEGRPHWLRTPEGDIRPVDLGEFAYFAYFTPVARIGYSIDIFEISPRDVAEWKSAVAAHQR